MYNVQDYIGRQQPTTNYLLKLPQHTKYMGGNTDIQVMQNKY